MDAVRIELQLLLDVHLCRGIGAPLGSLVELRESGGGGVDAAEFPSVDVEIHRGADRILAEVAGVLDAGFQIEHHILVGE